MENDVAVPTLPAIDVEKSVAFYSILGFETRLFQKSPIPYAVLARGGAQFHLYRMQGLDPENSYGGCIVEVDDVDDLHANFTAALRAELGRVPVSGLPRLTRMRKGQTRFSVIDPSGNWVLFVRRDEEGYEDGDSDEGLTPLGKALRTARRLRDFKNDDVAAAKVLDTALRKAEDRSGLEYARVLVWRAELAHLLGDPDTAAARIAQFEALGIADGERDLLAGDLAAFETAAAQK